MERQTSIDGFKALQERIIESRVPDLPTIVIPAGTCGQASGTNDLIRIAKREVLTKKLSDSIKLCITGCHGFCEMEPSLLIEPQRTFYPKVKPDDMPRIVDAVAKGEVIEELLYQDSGTGDRIEKQEDIPFFKNQIRTILSRSEKVDPIRIKHYIENQGYSAFIKVLTQGDQKAVIEEIKESGIRGRGGAGFPTGLKWEFLARQPSGKGKFLICNADEGDPGAYMDRSLLEGNPHSIIEGMLIGAFATGATEGIVYVRSEYPLAIKHLIIALAQARDLGLLGDSILGTNFSFKIKIVKGAGAFVCGEETALIHSIEGKMGEPKQRPPFPVEKGLFGQPTAINNVETWANISEIINQGAREFALVGNRNGYGTKIFSLVGKIKNTGLVEVPIGISVNEVINTIGGGSASSSKIKAVQTGGPSGGCIPAHKFDLPIDYKSLADAGSIMGSGGMIVMDENTCMVDVAKYFMNFLKDESCGKCFTCRKGIQRMYELLDDISKGEGTLEKLELLEKLAIVIKDTTMCGLGQSASNPVLSTLRYFLKEYKRHIVDKRCDAFVCKELVGAPCQSACPIDTEPWRYIAHLENGEYEKAYLAIRETNPLPSVCARVCDHRCETRCKMSSTGDQPIAIRALKRVITDRINPLFYQPDYKPLKSIKTDNNDLETPNIAIVGSGPAGLTAAHYLSVNGYQVTVFEAENEPGGMLLSGIPAYRLPRNVLRLEISSLLDENITLKCNTRLGKDITVDGLLKEGYRAVFLALGAHKSRKLNIEGENMEGVLPSMKFLKAFNRHGQALAKGDVVVIGGGNSAVDAARTAIRQPEVKSVTILYRRTRQEMPAYHEEIEAALEEGIKLEPLVSPIKIHSKDGQLSQMECIRNSLGEIDSSGRRSPKPQSGTEYRLSLDTLIVAISEEPEVDYLPADNIELSKWQTVVIDDKTFSTNRPGVFAGGDVVRGPSTVVDAIADGKKVAAIIDRYLNQEDLIQPAQLAVPKIYVEPPESTSDDTDEAERVQAILSPAESRQGNFREVEKSLAIEDATKEARRCLRCDLEFTKCNQ